MSKDKLINKLLKSKGVIVDKTFDLTTQDVAKMLDMSVDTAKKLAFQKKIPAIKIGGVWKFNKEEVSQYIESLRNRPLSKSA